jgi:hypothetical protein
MSEQAVAAAVLTLLRTSGSPPLTVHDGEVPTDPVTGRSDPPPYVLVYTTYEHPEGTGGAGNTVDGQSKTAHARFYCHCVGDNGQAARAVAGRVRTALLDVRPVVAGRTCGLIKEEQALPPERAERTGRLVMDAVRVYRVRTDPA